MGIIHSRAAKKRNKQEAKLLRAQRLAFTAQHRDEQAEHRGEQVAEREHRAEGLPWWQQPTIRSLLRALRKD